MKNLNECGVQEMNVIETKSINGGGEWSWGEAAISFALLGVVGVGFYYLGTQQ